MKETWFKSLGREARTSRDDLFKIFLIRIASNPSRNVLQILMKRDQDMKKMLQILKEIYLKSLGRAARTSRYDF